jgi:hypothetical protein
VCDHSPLNADDCKPNSALRTTVTVFLRTAEKKHALRQKELEAAAQKQPSQPVPEPALTPEVKATTPQPNEQTATPGDDRVATPSAKPNTPVTGPASLASNEEKKGSPGSIKVGSPAARLLNSN